MIGIANSLASNMLRMDFVFVRVDFSSIFRAFVTWQIGRLDWLVASRLSGEPRPARLCSLATHDGRGGT